MLNSNGPIKLILIGLFIGLAICASAQPPPPQCITLEAEVTPRETKVDRLDIPDSHGHPPFGLKDAKTSSLQPNRRLLNASQTQHSNAVKFTALGGPGGFLGSPDYPHDNSTPDGIGRYRHTSMAPSIGRREPGL